MPNPSMATLIQQARHHAQKGNFPAAQSACETILQKQPMHLDALTLLGQLYLERNQAAAALPLLRKAASLSGHASVLAAYATALAGTGKLTEAIGEYRRSLGKEAKAPVVWFQLANALQDVGNVPEATAALQQAIGHQPDFIPALVNLGLLLRQQGDAAGACELLERANKPGPYQAAAAQNLGALYRELGQPARAVGCFQTVLQLAPQSIDAQLGLATALAETGQFEAAVVHAQKSLTLAPQHPLVLREVGRIQQVAGNVAEARSLFERSLQNDNQSADTHAALALLLQQEQEIDRALEHYQHAANRASDNMSAWKGIAYLRGQRDELEPARAAYRQLAKRKGISASERILWELWADAVCPTIFADAAEIAAYRARLESALARTQGHGVSADPNLWENVACFPPFNLPFHGMADLPIKRAYATLYENALAQRGLPDPQPASNGTRPRVGFLVAPGHETPFVRDLAGMFAHFDRDAFEAVVLASPAGIKRIAAAIASSPGNEVEYIPLPARLSAGEAVLRSARLDLLYFHEIGTTVWTYFPALWKTARHQATGYGIQVTSGMAAMDHYLSSEWIEGPDADSHYREQLLRGKTLLDYRRMPNAALPLPTRGELGLPATGNLYLCPQQLGKFHPAFDDVIKGILARDPAGWFVLTEGEYPQRLVGLRQRWNRVLGPLAERIAVLPQLRGAAYSGLIAAGTLLVDPFPFGGMNVSYDGLALGKTLVTLPQTFQPSRYTAGLLTKIGVAGETVVHSATELAERAVALANQPERRREIERQIGEAASELFENRPAAVEFQELLLGICPP